METADKDAAEVILRRAFGRPVRLGDAEPLAGGDRSRVARFVVDAGSPSVPTHVVVKRAIPSGDEPDDRSPAAPAWRLFNEWASLQFLGARPETAALVPRLYGGDRESGVIVVEDLALGQGLHDLLLGSDPRVAEAALTAFAEALGRMHALTVGQKQSYDQIRSALGPQPKAILSIAAEAVVEPEHLAQPFRDLAGALAVPLASGIDRDFQLVAAAWVDPGPFLALTHGDPCPDNCLLAASGLKLLDFEFGAYRHALIDGVYGRMQFPSCWCAGRLPDRLVRAMEQAYRAQLVTGCPEAADDVLFGRAVVIACAYWTLGMFHWAYPATLQDDSVWGTTTLRQRVILRLDALAKAVDEYGQLAALGETAGTVAERLRARWAVEDAQLPTYPAFHG